MIVAIDGPAGSGKSSAARKLAERLGFYHLDTGAIYRAFTLRALRRGAALGDAAALAALVVPEAYAARADGHGVERIHLDGEDVTLAIRTPEVTNEVHWLANAAPVRERVTALARLLAEGRDVVVEGRDTTSVIFPHAEVKAFVDAAPEERARRRGKELLAKGMPQDPALLLAEIQQRDHRDRTRAVGPLVKVADAHVVDGTHLTLEGVVERLAEIVVRAREAGRG